MSIRDRFVDVRYALSFVCSVVLLTSSALKWRALVVNPTTFGQEMPGWMQLALIESECFLAIWLLTNVAAVSARRTAAFAFTLFAIVNIVKAWRGEESCGCFGEIQTAPELVLLLDLLLAIALWWSVGKSPAVQASSESRVQGVWMRLMLGAGVLFVGLFLNYGLMSRQHSVQITPDEGIYDFGVLPAGQSVYHKFTFKNESTHPVEIINVRSNCGCTTVGELLGTRVLPGAKFTLDVALAVGEGAHRGDVFVFYSAADGTISGQVSVRVIAQGVKDYELSPRAVDFGVVAGDAKVTQVVRVTPHQGAIDHLGIESAHPAFAAVMRPSAGSAEKEIEVTFDPAAWQGSGTLTSGVILTSATGHPERRLPVQVRVDKLYEVVPSAVVIDSQSRGELRREITIKSGRPCQIAAVQASGASIVSQSVSAAHACEHRIVISIADPGSLNIAGTVRFDISFEASTTSKARVVTVPIYRLAH